MGCETKQKTKCGCPYCTTEPVLDEAGDCHCIPCTTERFEALSARFDAIRNEMRHDIEVALAGVR